MKDNFITMAIESSCDETSVAILNGGREVLANIISSQIDIHKAYGGVVPEIASRHHLENINKVLDEALREANLSLRDIDMIGVTKGPGLVGALLVGVATAKALAYSLDIPLVGVHHITGHICANYIEYKDLEPPFLCLVASGGHTSLILAKDYTEYEVLGSSRDDAIGEAYDKVARVLNLGYPGGPKIDALAKDGMDNPTEFKRVFLEKGSLDFSFSGIKTGVLNYVNKELQQGNIVNKASVAAGFQESVLEVLITKTMDAIARTGMKTLAVAGGVAANSRLRELLKENCQKKGIRLCIPSPILCTDNGAMIGSSAYYHYLKGYRDNLNMDATSNLEIGGVNGTI